MIPVICGFSGALKSTLIKRLFPDRFWVQSPQKYLAHINYEYLSWSQMANPITMLLARFDTLQHVKNEKLVIERSYLDFIFYSLNYWKIDGMTTEDRYDIKGIHDELVKLLNDDFEYYIIDNQAEEFIKNTILGSEINRNWIYKSYDEYIVGQLAYTGFIKSHVKSYKILTLTDELVSILLSDQEYIPEFI